MDEDELQERRRSNLRKWVNDRGGVAAALDGRSGIPNSYPSYLSQLLNNYSFGSRAARTLESRLGMSPQWLDQSHSAVATDVRGPALCGLAAALEVVGIALAAPLPEDVRDDVADALHKLAKRMGAKRDQQTVLSLLQPTSGKQLKQA